jgi:hypothetical protein
MNDDESREIAADARRLLDRAKKSRRRGTAAEVQALNHQALLLLRECDGVPKELIRLFDCLLDRSSAKSVLARQREEDRREHGYALAIQAEARNPKISRLALARIVAEWRGGDATSYYKTVKEWRQTAEWRDMLERLRQYYPQ